MTNDNMSQNGQLLSVAYRLYDVSNGQKELIEETQGDKPFTFISGMGIVLEDFEKQLVGLAAGDSFDFNLTPAQAYGERYEERVITVDKDIFTIDGKFDQEHIFPNAIVPLQNENGDRFSGRVLEVGAGKVKIDLNHPLAGMTLNFVGQVLVNREASVEEIASVQHALTGDGCGGHCDGCDGGCCGGDEEHENHGKGHEGHGEGHHGCGGHHGHGGHCGHHGCGHHHE